MSAHATALPATPNAADSLLDRYRRVREATERICEPLAIEDHCIQSMENVSPAKWHLAHTSWFFEQFILLPHARGYDAKHPQYNYLFNSYYNTVGPQHCRPQRGLLSRPTVEEVRQYRQHVDAGMHRLLEGDPPDEVADLLTIGLNHEQQHQELMVSDLKHIFSSNPLLPAYHARATDQTAPARSHAAESTLWCEFDKGVHEIGLPADAAGFPFDHETPRHKVYLQPFAIAHRLVTNGEYLRFIEDGGYRRHDLWLSLGWATVNDEAWTCPLYWYQDGGGRWMQYTMGGPMELDPAEPASHLSLFEADAYARWAGARLPTEAEWEVAADRQGGPIEGNFAESGRFHPVPAGTDATAADGHRLQQMFGNLWEWTGSQYRPYPGYQPLPGALGEYNGKFMANQFVLRGGSCATPKDHLRLTYRNFFEPSARWQFTGLRLARDL